MQIIEKRGHYYVVNENGDILLKTNVKAEAESLQGSLVGESSGSKTKKEKSSKKETNTNKQKTVLDSKSSD